MNYKHLHLKVLLYGFNNQLDDSLDTKQKEEQKQSPLQKRMNSNQHYLEKSIQNQTMYYFSILSSRSWKPASSHISTPLFTRKRVHNSTPILSRVKPVSQHIPTPIPQHSLQSSLKRPSTPLSDHFLNNSLSHSPISLCQSRTIFFFCLV